VLSFAAPFALAFALLAVATIEPFAPSAQAAGSDAAYDPGIDGTWGTLGLTPMLPSKPDYHCAVHDPVGDRMIIAGLATGETWALSLDGTETWTKLVASGSPTTPAARMVYDPLRQRIMFVAGGYTSAVWVLDMNDPVAWTQLTVGGTAPVPRAYPVVAFDAAADRVIMSGGWNGSAGVSDTWALDMTPAPTWHELAPTGTPPAPGSWISGAFDPVGRRLYVYAGYSGGLYRLDLSGAPAWSTVTPGAGSPTPPHRGYATAVYLPSLDAFVMQGGNNISVRLSDAWMCQFGSSPTWIHLEPSGTPPPVADLEASIYDPVRLRMVIFGGTGSQGYPTTLTWQGDGPPIITSVNPIAGPVGTVVVVSGSRFDGVTDVDFGDLPAEFTPVSPLELHATVPPGATSSRIRVTTPLGSGLSAVTFTVSDPPVLESAEPASAKPGRAVLLRGRNLALVTGIAFSGSDSAIFTVLSDSTISTIVPAAAVNGPIRTKSVFGTLPSSFEFTVLPLEARPQLVGVRDVPNDQGGSVILRWEGSDLDTPVNHQVTRYRVWRRAPLGAAAALIAGAPAPSAAGPPGFWEVVGEMPSAQLGGYAFTANTFQDSLDSGPGYVAFFVQALTAVATDFYFSDVDSGYSVDNLAPPAPGQLHVSYTASQLRLGWAPSRAPDLREYRIYRGADASFPLEPATFVGATTDTQWTETVSYGSWYKLVAVDVHGNLSRVAMVGPDAPVAALVSLLNVAVTARSIRLTWVSAANPGLPATVYRRVGQADWQAVAVLHADGSGRLVYDDRTVERGVLYGYRLGVLDGDGEVFLGDAWARAEDPAFAPAALTPNPARGVDLSLRFGLAAAERVRVDVHDIAGRRVASFDFGLLDPGPHDLQLRDSGRLAAGVYLIRFRHGDAVQTVRGVILD